MKIALCTCEGRVERKDLEKIENAIIFDTLCCEDLESKFDIIGCSHPSLRNAGKILIDLNNLVFLRQKDSAEKAKIILKAYSQLLSVEPYFMEAEVDNSLLVKTDDHNFASMLSKHFEPLYVLTDNRSISDIALAIEGKLESISGSIGEFEVRLNGIDMRTGKRISNIRVSQILIPGINDPREGIFSSELEAVEAIYNRGGVLKVKSLEYRDEMCGVSYNGIGGCKLCRCPHGLIQHRESVVVDEISCPGCGLCSALCPSDALSFRIFPRNVVLRMIQTMAEYRKRKTLLYVCRNAVTKVYGSGKTESFFPVILPCINSLSEVEVLLPLVSGFSGVCILPCDCPHGDFEGIKRAAEIAEAFGIERIAVEKDFHPELIERMNRLKPISSDFKLGSSRKREQLLEIIAFLKQHFEPATYRLSFDNFGMLNVSDSCTLCKTCQSVCPMNAIDRRDGRLEFIHGLCINCDLCRIFCPENSITIESCLNLAEADSRKVLKELKMIKCPRCQRKHISENEYRKISALTGQKTVTLYCDSCKPVIVFEGIYREVKGEENEQDK